MGKSDGFGFLSKIFIMPQVSLNGSFFLSEINASEVYKNLGSLKERGILGEKNAPKCKNTKKFSKFYVMASIQTEVGKTCFSRQFWLCPKNLSLDMV